MDCNKDNALRAKDIAERKIARNDYVGAKKFARKAKELCPELEFISLFITIIDVYLSRMKLENGESDWYGVLGLKESDPFEEQCRIYYNLSGYIRANINNVVGAEGALRILLDAFCKVTRTFWTKCSKCCFRFMFSVARINEELECVNCHERFIAVPLPSGSHPTHARMMSEFSRMSQHENSMILALPARR